MTSIRYVYVCIYMCVYSYHRSRPHSFIYRENQLSRLVSMDHGIKSVFLLILLLLFTNPSSGEIALPTEQAEKVAATAADLGNSVNHVNPESRKVPSQMHPRKLMITTEVMLDYERPKPNPRHDDKGKPGGG